MDEHAAARATSFRRDHLAWIVVRHFLSADLLGELGRALVDVVTRGERTLDDLFETTRTAGPSTLVAWVAQPRPVELTIDRALQALVRSLAWTWDDRSTGDVTGVAAHEAESLKAIDTAFSVARLDFDSLAPFRARGAPPDRLRVVTEALSLVASSPEGERRCVDDACHSLTSQFEAPLGAIVVKHLGDLCADVDRWHLASEFYARSQTLLAGEAEGHWSSLIDFLRDAVSQSQASARWSLEGPAAASQAYDAIIRDAGPLNRPPWLLNVAVDAMSARMATRVGAPFRDDRAVVALGPQLLDTHDLGGALALWRGQEYWAAQDRFWAVLRRQTALGSALASRTTKALYGAAIVDALRAGLGRRLEPVTFRMGVRLLIEGGDEDVADRVDWVERLVAENLDPDLVSYALAHAHGAPGFLHDRMSVVLTLFKHWVLALPEGAASLSRTMLTSLAASAGATGDVDVARLSEIALNGLSKIAQARPEFLALASLEITASAVSLIERGGLIGAGHALQFAFENMHAFGETELAALVRATLHRLRTFEPAQSPWPVVRPAIALLASRRVLTLCAGDEELKETVPATLVSFALGSDSEYASVMYLLRDLDPSWAHERVDVSRLEEVVGELRERAGQINSSRASEDVLALLVAPAISQADGVRDALDALRRMVSSAATDRPALAFERAYKPVMLAADDPDEDGRRGQNARERGPRRLGRDRHVAPGRLGEGRGGSAGLRRLFDPTPLRPQLHPRPQLDVRFARPSPFLAPRGRDGRGSGPRCSAASPR